MKWIKPSGLEMNINDTPETVKYAESLGWKRVTEKKVRAKRVVKKAAKK